MGASASIFPAAVQVEPGTQVAATIRVRNTGAIVDRFDCSVVGPAAGWTRVEPASLSLFPGQDGEARIVFAPPRAPAPHAATLPFAIKVVPAGSPADATVEEGRVTVLPFTAPSARVVPQTSRGSRVGRHQVVIENDGNTPLGCAVAASDPDQLLTFEVAPEQVVVGPGGRVTVSVLARPVETFAFGSGRSLPFTIDVRPAGGVPLSLRASLAQRSALPAWLIPVAGLGAAAALALVLLPGLVGGPPDSAATDVPITPPPTPIATPTLVTDGPSPEASPDGTPTEAPTEAPSAPSAPIATVQIGDLQLEDLSNEGAVNPSFTVTSDGPGELLVTLARLTDFSGEGVRLCIAPAGGRQECRTLRERGSFSRRSGAPSTTWTVTVTGIAQGFAPNVSLAFEYPAMRPSITYRDNSIFDGSQVAGFTALVTAREAGTLDLQAEFDGNFCFYAWSIRDTNELGTPAPLQPTGPLPEFLLPPVGLTPGRTYELTFRGMSAPVDRLDWSATISWR